MVHGLVTRGSFGVSINGVVYYLDGGVVGLVMLDLSVEVGFWMRWCTYRNFSEANPKTKTVTYDIPNHKPKSMQINYMLPLIIIQALVLKI